ncbi:MAG: tol-pal system protein YbgF [Legionella sp.]|uniref:tol-pal system protein YbgF n=1 Tax=Legionella sp. TaxID=459 RepID=UPI0039E3E5A0
MIHCKKHIIAAGLMLILPLTSLAGAPVVDESDNFAMYDGQQVQEPASNSKYDVAQNDRYPSDRYQEDDGLALARDDSASNGAISESASLIDKIQSLQQEVQELRGQLEVQAHDLKLLQQQQIAFYKDLDSRLSGGTAAKAATPGKPAMDLSVGGAKEPASRKAAPVAQNNKVISVPTPTPVSKANPADEQISYLAAYELVKNRRYDDALNAMNQFAQKYPAGGYTANAQYWLGELYLVKKEYASAVDHFNIVLQQFPASSKSAASMLKVGYAYAAMGNRQEAQKYLQQVVRAYPNTPTAQLASSKLQTI